MNKLIIISVLGAVFIGLSLVFVKSEVSRRNDERLAMLADSQRTISASPKEGAVPDKEMSDKALEVKNPQKIVTPPPKQQDIKVSQPTKAPKSELAKAPKPEPILPPPPPPSPAPALQAPDPPFAFNQSWRNAVVNIYCFLPYGEGTILGGSGVIIDPRGVILTNAHVALALLYYDTPKESRLDCSVRIGSPASPEYRAKLLYIPEGYINDDLTTVGKGHLLGYGDFTHGKDDYALLAITKTIVPQETLPASFPYLPLEIGRLPLAGSSMFMIGYAASFLGDIGYMKDLSQLASPVVVSEIRSIKGNTTPDVLSFKGATAGQFGSSGGAVVASGGKLIAIPTFFDEEGQGESTAEAVTNAITIEYINRDLKADTGFSLEEFLARDTPQALSKAFLAEKAPIYHQKYVDQWAKMNTRVYVPGGY